MAWPRMKRIATLATVALLAALSAGLVDAGPATAAPPPSVPSPSPVPTSAASTLKSDQPPVSVGDGTVRVGPVTLRNPAGGRHVAYATDRSDDAAALTGCAALAAWLQVVATVHLGPVEATTFASSSSARHAEGPVLGDTG